MGIYHQKLPNGVGYDWRPKTQQHRSDTFNTRSEFRQQSRDLRGIKMVRILKINKNVIAKIEFSHNPDWIKVKYSRNPSTLTWWLIWKYKKFIWFWYIWHLLCIFAHVRSRSVVFLFYIIFCVRSYHVETVYFCVDIGNKRHCKLTYKTLHF